MNIADLTKKHGNVNFSSFDEAKKSDGDNVRWVRSDHASFHIRNGGELWHYASSIEEVDNILSNMELLKSWTETVLKELKSIKQVKAVVTSGYYITSYVVLVSIKSIGFEARVELDKALDGSLCVLLAPEQKYRKTTLNGLHHAQQQSGNEGACE